jgi:OOP family OmpA-OmpF porin
VGLLSLAWLLFRILGSPFLLFWLGLLLMALALRAWLGGSLLARKLGCLPLALGVLFAAYLLIRIGAFALLFSSGCLGFALAAALLWAFYRVVRAAGLAAFGLFAVGLACAGLLWHRSPPPPPATFTQGAAPGYAPPQPAYLPQALVGVVPLDKAMEDPGAFFDHPGQRLLLDNELLFPFESAQLSSEAMGSLHKLARLLRSHPTARVVLEGHTDTIGTAEANQQLSALRAEAVKDCLVGRFHLDPGQLSIRGAGSANPLIAAGDAQAQSRNRRVEVRVAEPEPKPVPEAEPEPEPETE